MLIYNRNQCLMHLALMVQDYNLDIHHKNDTENVLADALPRF